MRQSKASHMLTCNSCRFVTNNRINIKCSHLIFDWHGVNYVSIYTYDCPNLILITDTSPISAKKNIWGLIWNLLHKHSNKKPPILLHPSILYAHWKKCGHEPHWKLPRAPRNESFSLKLGIVVKLYNYSFQNKLKDNIVPLLLCSIPLTCSAFNFSNALLIKTDHSIPVFCCTHPFNTRYMCKWAYNGWERVCGRSGVNGHVDLFWENTVNKPFIMPHTAKCTVGFSYIFLYTEHLV